MPIEAANIVKVPVKIRVSRLWPAFLLADRVVSCFGLSFPTRFVAWVAGHSVQALIGGRWKVIPVPVDEVLESCGLAH